MDNLIRIDNISAGQALEFKYDLEKAGLIMNVDFQWFYHSAALDDFVGHSFVEFTFLKPALATYYKLKWE